MVFTQKTASATENIPKVSQKQRVQRIQVKDDVADIDLEDDSEMEMDDDVLVQKTNGKKTLQAKTLASKQTPNKKQAAKFEEEEDDDDDDDDDDEEEDVDEEEDDEEDVDEEDDDEEDDDDEEEDDDEEDHDVDDEGSEGDNVQNKKSLPVKKAKQGVTSQTKSPKAQNLNKNRRAELHDPSLRCDIDLRTLFIRLLPIDTTPEELKTLSPDIVNVSIPSGLKRKFKNDLKHLYAFVEFLNEEKAEENFIILKSKKFRDQPLDVDYCGEKSSFKKDVRKLCISEIPLDATKAVSLILNQSNEDRFAMAEFRTVEDMNECLNASENVQVAGKAVTVKPPVDTVNSNKRKQSLPTPQNAKRSRIQVKKEEPHKDDENE